MQVGGETEKSKGMQGASDRDNAIVYAALSDIGLVRTVNEDRCSVISTPEGLCYLVLDGMGGVEGGEFAAQLSIDAVQRSLLDETPRELLESLQGAFEEANRTIVLRRQNFKFKEMGTTIVGAMIEGSAVAVAHVGDSRAYLVRAGCIEQLTIDHTYVQQLVDRKEISKEEALPHPQSHILTQCLGSSSSVLIDARRYWIWPLEKGQSSEFIVMCTDGLYSMVSDEEICAVVSTLSPQEACDELIQLSNARGGFDNVTVSIIPLNGHLRESVSPTWKKEVARRERSKRLARWWQRSIFLHCAVAVVGGLLATVMATGMFIYLWVL